MTDPGKAAMKMEVKKVGKVERYKTSNDFGQEEDEKAGIAHRMKDGSMVYAPETMATE